MTLKLRGKVWKYPGMAAWYFVSLPIAAAKRIKKSQEGRPRVGFGSIRVRATIGGSRWNTSIFPDSKSGTYVLPLKAQIRKKEDIGEKETVSFVLEF